jgi:hypothetical protein
LIIDLSSRSVVTGAAYLPSLAGGTSLREERSSSRCVGTGVAYRPNVAGGALRSLFSTVEGHIFRPAEAGDEAGLLGVDDMADEEVVISC